MRSPAPAVVACLAGLAACLASGRSSADEQGPAAQAARVVAAVDAGEAATVARLAARIVPDRWILADEIVRGGRADAAHRFAARVPAPEGAKLLAYLRARGKGAGHPEVRRALGRARAANTTEEVAAALVALRALGTQGDAWECVQVALAIGTAQARLGRHAEAAAALQAAGARAKELGWLQGAASAWSQAARSAWASFDADATRRCFEEHFDVEDARDSPDGRGIALQNLGSLAGMLGDFRRAERFYGRAFALLEGLQPEGPDEGRSLRLARYDLLRNMAECARRSGRLREAQERLDAAAAVLVPAEDVEATADTLGLRAGLAGDMGDDDEALRYTEEAADVYRQLLAAAPPEAEARRRDLERKLAQLEGSRGAVLHRMRRPRAAKEALEAARAQLERVGSLADRVAIVNNLGLVAGDLGALEAAEASLRRAIDLAERAGDRFGKINAQQNLSMLLLRAKRLDEAQALQLEALSAAKRAAAQRLVADGHAGMARIWRARGDPRKALVSAELAIEVRLQGLEGLTSAQGPRARARNAGVFDIGLESALALDDTERAWWILEKSRAYILLETLQGREEVRDARYPRELLAEEREHERRVAQARSESERASRSGNLEHRRRLRARLDKALAEQRAVAGRILRAARSTATLFHGVTDETAEIQRLLEPTDVYVAYALTRRRAVALVLDRKDARLVDLGPAGAVRAALAEVDWSSASTPVDVKQRNRLAAVLLARLKLPAAAERLILSPAGELAGFPFAALLPDKQLAFVPSGTTWRVLRTQAEKRGKGVLGIGAPDYTGRPSSLLALQGSGEEIERVATKKLLGKDANEAALRAALREQERWRAVHVACHATTDPKDPLRSALALARTDAEADDGYLTALEVLRMDVPAELAVLSACVTGVWRHSRLDGLGGLPRAFMVAGSPRVIASLWDVDDEATKELMIRFHELWNPREKGRRALSAAAALQQAQRDIRAKEKWAHPYYWAGWVLWGVAD